MKIVDFHAHIYPHKIAEKAVKSVGDFYNLNMHGDGTSERLLENGKKLGISDFVVHSVAITPSNVETINNYIAMECKNHEEFNGFGTIHPDYVNKFDELERVRNLGLKGIKIHPDTQFFNMDDEKMFDIYDYLRENDMPILIHCGDYRYSYSHPKRLANILDNFPGLTVIAAHFGGWSVYDIALEYLKNRKCYLDTSSSFAMIGIKRAKELIRIYGAERMVFGTDFPMWNADEELENFQKLNLTEEENELIYYKNAYKILKKG